MGISHPVNCLTIILSILFLQWIQALFYYLRWKVIYINPIKLVTENYRSDSITEIEIHGRKFKGEKYIKKEINDKTLVEMKKRLKKIEENQKIMEQKKLKEERLKEKEREKERKREEEWEKKRKRDKENTQILIEYKTNNYCLEIEKFYDDVYLNLTVKQRTEYDKKERIKLGEYEEYYEGKNPKRNGNITTYYPPGTSETIRVDMSQSNQYKISVKNFDNWYYYRDKN